MCGAEALLIAIGLAAQLVHPDYSTMRSNSITTVCGCQCGVSTTSEVYACMAAEAKAKEDRVREHNEKVKEFEQIARMCGIEVKP